MHMLRVITFVSLLCMAFLTNAGTVERNAEEVEMEQTLLSWAVKLSGMPKPKVAPIVEYVPHEFFVTKACGGNECKVWGWYPNTGGNIVYVDERFHAILFDGSDGRSVLAASVIVHEMVHYLQAVTRRFALYQCKDAIALEIEAYGVQQAYINAYGRYMPVGVSMHNAGCEDEPEVGSASAPAEKK